jgi:Methyltransferase domain
VCRGGATLPQYGGRASKPDRPDNVTVEFQVGPTRTQGVNMPNDFVLPQGEIKLHVGCADLSRPGYVNIDVRETAATDLVTDAWALPMIPDESVTEIYTRHTIEHLEPDDAAQALREWFRVLKQGGYAHIICPDLEFHCKQLLGMAESPIFADQQVHAMAGFYGWKVPSRGGSLHDSHRWGYVFATLTERCLESGFTRVERVLDGTDSEPWHLNIKAHKERPAA